MFFFVLFEHIFGFAHVRACINRDLVSNPVYREDLKMALMTRLEPWIDCQEADKMDR